MKAVEICCRSLFHGDVWQHHKDTVTCDKFALTSKIPYCIFNSLNSSNSIKEWKN